MNADRANGLEPGQQQVVRVPEQQDTQDSVPEPDDAVAVMETRSILVASDRSTAAPDNVGLPAHPFGANDIRHDDEDIRDGGVAFSDPGQNLLLDTMAHQASSSQFFDMAQEAPKAPEVWRRYKSEISSGSSEPKKFVGRAQSAWSWFTSEWNDTDRNCYFEIQTLLFRQGNAKGNMAALEAARYREKLLSYPAWKQLWTILFNVLFGILDPGSGPRIAWDMSMVLSLLYIAMMVPVYIAFSVSAYEIAPWLFYLDKVIDVLFIVDISVNLRTGHIDLHGQVVRSRKKIFTTYASSWLLLDIMSSIPFDWFLGSNASGIRLVKTSKLSKLIKILRILRLVKLIRVIKISSSSMIMDSLLDKNVAKTAAFFFSGAFVAHFMGCINYWVAALVDEDAEFPGWTTILEGEHLDNEWGIREKYIASLYWSFSTITTVGYGDIYPTNKWERVVAIISMVVGVTAFGYFMGSMTSMVQAINESRHEKSKRTEALEKFLKNRAIPQQLGGRISQHYQFIWDRHLHKEEQAWLDGLSSNLRTETILFLYQNVIRRVPFFEKKSPHLIARMVVHLQPEAYTTHDVIVREGEPATCMYFLSRGILHACMKVGAEQAHSLLTGGSIQDEKSYDGSGMADLKKLKNNGKRSFVMKIAALNRKVDAEQERRRNSVSMLNNARRKIMSSMPTLVSSPSRRFFSASELQDSDDDDHFYPSEEAAFVYVIPDDTMDIHAVLERKLNIDYRHAAHGTDGWKDDIHTFFASSRRATKVMTNSELHSEISRPGRVRHAYCRTESLYNGCYFGEYSCLNNLPRTVTTVAAENVEVFRLKQSALASILAMWPDVAQEFRRAGWKSSEHGSKASERSVSDKFTIEKTCNPAGRSMTENAQQHQCPLDQPQLGVESAMDKVCDSTNGYSSPELAAADTHVDDQQKATDRPVGLAPQVSDIGMASGSTFSRMTSDTFMNLGRPADPTPQAVQMMHPAPQFIGHGNMAAEAREAHVRR